MQRQFDLALQMRERKNLPGAYEALREIDQHEPDNPLVLQLLCEVSHNLEDYPTYLSAADRLVKVVPDQPDFLLMRAGAYLANGFPVLALREFQTVLARWPG